MKPIINPLWFYLIDIATGLDDIFFGLAFVIGFITVVILIVGAGDIDFKHPNTIKRLKRAGAGIIFCLILSGLIPSQDTCYKMMTAALVTPNNITAVGEAATDVVDYIVDSVDKLLEGDKAAEEYEEDKESE